MREPIATDILEPTDYVLDETFRRQENNRLLDADGAGVNPALRDASECALAAIADAVHTHARHLRPEQAELAVKWLKKWKLRSSSPPAYDSRRATEAFWDKLEALKISPEQVRLQRVAARHATWSRVWGVAFALVLALLAGVALAGGGWMWCTFLAAVGLGTLVANERSLVKALMAAKDQDRRYLMQSIRTANTVSEMLNAGICAYIPGVLYEGPSYDERYAKQQMAAERERLTDALYLDPDDYLDPYSYRDPGPRA